MRVSWQGVRTSVGGRARCRTLAIRAADGARVHSDASNLANMHERRYGSYPGMRKARSPVAEMDNHKLDPLAIAQAGAAAPARRRMSMAFLMNATGRRMSQNLAINKKVPLSELSTRRRRSASVASVEPQAAEDEDDDINPCYETAMDFINKTYMHGFKFVTEPFKVQRIFWAIITFGALCLSVFVVARLIVKWQNEPLLVSLDTSPTPIWEVPFPAVTVCNMNHVRKSQALKVAQRLKDDPNDLEAQARASLVDGLCKTNTNNHPGFIEREPSPDAPLIFWKRRNTTIPDVKNFVEDLGHGCDEMVSNCRLDDIEVPCGEIFKNVDTDLGRCCSFNHVDQSLDDWEIQDGYSSDPFSTTGDVETNAGKRRNELPHRALGPGLSNGLTFTLDVQPEEEYCSRYESRGFRVLFHNPTSTPLVSDYGFVVPTGFEYFVPVWPNMVHADSAIYHIDPSIRQCFLTGERKLGYFAHYTESNCFTECAANRTYRLCGCVPHYLPHEDAQSVCSSMAQIRCSASAVNRLREIYETGVISGCSCMQGCTELDYSMEITRAPLRRNQGINKNFTLSDNLRSLSEKADKIKSSVFSNNSTVGGEKESNVTAAHRDRNLNLAATGSNHKVVMHVFFKSENFFMRRRGELYGAIDFFSNAGGLLGATVGFSALSMVELLYFFYLRLFCPCARKIVIENKDKLREKMSESKF